MVLKISNNVQYFETVRTSSEQSLHSRTQSIFSFRVSGNMSCFRISRKEAAFFKNTDFMGARICWNWSVFSFMATFQRMGFFFIFIYFYFLSGLLFESSIISGFWPVLTQEPVILNHFNVSPPNSGCCNAVSGMKGAEKRDSEPPQQRVVIQGLIRVAPTSDISIGTAFIFFILYQYKQKYPFLSLDVVSSVANFGVHSN